MLKSVLALFFLLAFFSMVLAFTRYSEPAGDDGKEEHVWLNTFWGLGILAFFVLGAIVLTT